MKGDAQRKPYGAGDPDPLSADLGVEIGAMSREARRLFVPLQAEEGDILEGEGLPPPERKARTGEDQPIRFDEDGGSRKMHVLEETEDQAGEPEDDPEGDQHAEKKSGENDHIRHARLDVGIDLRQKIEARQEGLNRREEDQEEQDRQHSRRAEKEAEAQKEEARDEEEQDDPGVAAVVEFQLEGSVRAVDARVGLRKAAFVPEAAGHGCARMKLREIPESGAEIRP